jgi:hypothetical protein
MGFESSRDVMRLRRQACGEACLAVALHVRMALFSACNEPLEPSTLWFLCQNL